jgi:amino acid transporter
MDSERILQKKLSPVHVTSLAMGCIIGGSCFVLPGNSFLPKAGPAGVVLAMVFAAAIMLVIAVNYSYMVNLFPLAGGEFTYATQAFGSFHGFVCSWFLSLSYIALVPLNATALALMGRTLFGSLFSVGFHYTVAGYDVYLGEVLLAYAALALFALASIRGVQISGILQTLLVFGLAAGVAVLAVAAVLSPDLHIDSLKPLFASDKSAVGCTLAILVVAPYCFVGFDTIPQSAEEFKFSPGKTRKLMAAAIVFGAWVYIAVNLVTAAVVPEGYTDWEAYLKDLPNLQGLLTMPTFYAAWRLLGRAGLAFLGIAVFSACLTGIVGFYMASSRLLYSMGKERVLPHAFALLGRKYKTPYVAIGFVFVLSLLGPLFGRTVLGWIVDMTSVGAAFGYAYTSLAAWKYAKINGSRAVRVSGMAGFFLGLVFLALLLIPIPSLGCSLGREAYICLVIWIVLGFVFYSCTKKREKERE